MPTLARLVILSNNLRILFISWLAILTQLYDADFIKSKIPYIVLASLILIPELPLLVWYLTTNIDGTLNC